MKFTLVFPFYFAIAFCDENIYRKLNELEDKINKLEEINHAQGKYYFYF